MQTVRMGCIRRCGPNESLRMSFAFHERAPDLMVTLRRILDPTFPVDKLQVTFELRIQELDVNVVQGVCGYTPGTVEPYNLNVSPRNPG